MEKLLTTADLAEAIGTSESSMRRWTNNGVIKTSRTAGGHRRIVLSEAIRFIRETGAPLVRPDLLGLPDLRPISGEYPGVDSSNDALFEMLRSGNARKSIACVTSLYLGGSNVASICDSAIQDAMRRVGELWRDDPRGILVEHRATDICIDALGVIRQMLPEPADDAPLALGGAPARDPYFLPSLMAAMVLNESGYRDENYGPNTPVELLAAAAEDKAPRIVWLAIKPATDRVKLRTDISELAGRVQAAGSTLVIGGSGAESLALRSSKNVHVMKTMTELAAFSRGMLGNNAGANDPLPLS